MVDPAIAAFALAFTAFAGMSSANAAITARQAPAAIKAAAMTSSKIVDKAKPFHTGTIDLRTKKVKFTSYSMPKAMAK